MSDDILDKRGKFIGKINSLMQELHFASSEVLVKLLNTYATSFYGSPLWDPLSPECERLYKSWNVTLRHIFNVDRKTHRYLIEPMSQCVHPKVMLLSRLVGFRKTLANSPKFSIRYLCHVTEKDHSTVFGRTLHSILKECDLKENEFDKLNPQLVKRKILYQKVPEEEQWRVPVIREILGIRNGTTVNMTGLDIHQLNDILEHVCVN